MKTHYQLPYRVDLPAPDALSRGATLTLRLGFPGPVPEEAMAHADALLTGFEVLASSGALAGRAVDPARSDFVRMDPVVTSEQKVDWQLTEAWLDPAAATVLAQMFLMLDESAGLQSVALAADGRFGGLAAMDTVGRHDSIYPALHPSVAGITDIAAQLSDDVLVTVVYADHPDAAQQQEITGRVNAWLSAAMEGFYPIAPLHPQDCRIRQFGEAEFHAGEMELPLNRFRCHPEALNGLANALKAAEPQGPALRRIAMD